MIDEVYLLAALRIGAGVDPASLSGVDPAPLSVSAAARLNLPIGSVRPMRGRCLGRLRKILEVIP
ncbi:hypothetical protein AB0K60_00970 [Thermopolyspora sp. NPDC052614]|uniref:hypothetical protein n=1 Tax=Thermopolyspora sp. NPDC052614 TaxID=3155682 RepID=UPI00342F29D7